MTDSTDRDELFVPSSGTSLDEKDKQLVSDIFELIQAGSREPEDVTGYDVITAEREFAYFVRKGRIDALQEVHMPSIGFVDSNKNWVRFAKNELISLNTVCLHAAIDGGVSVRVAFGLGNSFLKRIESLSNESSVQAMIGSRIIPLSYCMLVSELSQPEITDKDVLKALRFIHEHHHERISVGQVARFVGLSPEHLSAKFRAQTNQTVHDYIVGRRIQEAKALLRFTDYSIGEIAGLLCFSSQSYFQTVFKKKVGMTPLQYRMGAVG